MSTNNKNSTSEYNEENSGAKNNYTRKTGNDIHIESEGIVLDSIRSTITVQLLSGQTILCHLSGKMRQNKIKILVGDKVKVKISPYDMSRGFVIHRMK